jgi:ABC-2 type transport system ATP-binding protein
LITGHYMAEAEYCDRLALLVDGRLSDMGTPAELRREALGGDIIEVVVAGSLSQTMDLLRDDPIVRSVEVRGRDRLWVAVEDAGPSVPDIVDRLHAANIEISSVNEVRPPFDEIFERLVTRHV